jgi:flagellar M-ring protein FliF
MSNALTPAPQGSTGSGLAAMVPERFANPLNQLQGLFAQPAVRRSLPMALLIGLIGAAALAWMMLASPNQKVLFAGLADADKASVTTALQAANITSKIDAATGSLTVNEDDYSRARILLAGQGLPKAAPGGYAILDNLPMGVSRAVEGERLRQARETELARSIQEIDAVAEARVHLATPEQSVFVRDSAAPSASVIVKLQPGRTLGDAQVSSIINLVASSVPGMKPEGVTIVDQMGGLLTKGNNQSALGIASDERVAFQRRIEEKYRAQVVQMLTPLIGAGNFTTEVQADVDLNETQATKESYDKQGVLRVEQGQWTGNGKDGQAPGGIPGALSNTPPPASTLSAPQPTPTPTPAPGATPVASTPGATGPVVAAAAGAVSDALKASDQYSRAYDLGKEVSVSRTAPGTITRLSVAVLLRDPETGKPRSQLEIQQITQLVQTAVGYSQPRGDQVTVISRKFAGATALDDKQPWYEAGWLPVVARNVTALVIALLVLFLGVRPLATALLKKRDDNAAQPRAALGREIGPPDGYEGGQIPPPRSDQPVSIDALENARNYDDRIGMVRGFTRDNPARAALAVRDMIKS